MGVRGNRIQSKGQGVGMSVTVGDTDLRIRRRFTSMEGKDNMEAEARS